ncbi:MAG: hypothetical protein ACKV2T_17285 [Kofleriaceae bacterium]
MSAGKRMAEARQQWTGQTIIAAIRRLRRERKSLAWSKAPLSLRKAAEYHVGSWRAAIEAAGIDYKTVSDGHRHTDEELIAWLSDIARRQPQMTLSELDKTGRLGTLKSHFGSWQQAVARAGLRDWPTVEKPRWTPEQVLDRLRELYGSGRTANDDERVYRAAKTHFGSLAAAAKRAGIEINLPRFWTRDELIETLERIERKHGEISDALLARARCRTAVATFFGGLDGAARELGLTSHSMRQAKERAALDDRRETLKRLRALAKQLGRPVTAMDIPAGLRDALLRRFGTVKNARVAARLPHPTHKKWDRERAIAELRNEHQRGTRLTEPGLMRAKRKDLVHALREHIGSLPQARRVAGVPEPTPLPRKKVPFQKEWDADRVLDEILRRSDAGESLAPSRVPQPLYGAASRYLGSWREAIEAAGFEYNAVVLNRPFDDGEMLDILRRLSVDKPNMTFTELQHEHLATSLHRWYGGVANAVRLAGIENWPVRIHYPRMTRDEVRRALQQRLANGDRIDRPSITADDQNLAYSVKMIHPDWTEAILRLELGQPRERSRR